MSVLIKDMEMPETCDDCPFHVYHSHYEYVCKATPMLYHMNLANTKGIRKEWCPLIEPEPKWIPCSEKLPEETEARYWVCTDGGYQCQCRWTNDVFGLGEGDTWTWKIFDIPQYSKVIAWMPLPEPYRGEGEK